MTLRLVLKSGEDLRLGRTRVTVVSQGACTILIEGSGPVLRGVDYVDPDAVDDPATLLRGIVQRIYLEEDLEGNRVALEMAADALLEGHPHLGDDLENLRLALARGEMWVAIKLARRLAACGRSQC